MNTYRTFAIGDIHGGYKALKQLITQLDLQYDDQLIFLGDYVDGWSESAQVVRYLIELSETYTCIFIKGNHDIWCEDWLRTGYGEPVWLMHGGKATIASYEGFGNAERATHLEFFERMPLYHIDTDKRLFIHAGFTSMHGVTQEKYETNFYFDRTLWEMALTVNESLGEENIIYPERLKHYKEIYIGHTPTTRYDSELPMQAANVWNVDTGAAFAGKLSAVEINSKAIYQSDAVMRLYPEEEGRNEMSYQKRIMSFKRRL